MPSLGIKFGLDELTETVKSVEGVSSSPTANPIVLGALA
jgi:hypothetical protein